MRAQQGGIVGAHDDEAPWRAVAVARKVHLELGVAVAAVVEALCGKARASVCNWAADRDPAQRSYQRLELVLAAAQADRLDLDVPPRGVRELRAVDADVGAEAVVGVHAEGVHAGHLAWRCF